MTAAERFARLSTAAKFLLILTAVLLPIGIALTWLGENGIQQANGALEGRAEDQSRAAAEGIQSLIARNALALRIATNGALAGGEDAACDRAKRSLSVAPAVAQSFELEIGRRSSHLFGRLGRRDWGASDGRTRRHQDQDCTRFERSGDPRRRDRWNGDSAGPVLRAAERGARRCRETSPV